MIELTSRTIFLWFVTFSMIETLTSIHVASEQFVLLSNETTDNSIQLRTGRTKRSLHDEMPLVLMMNIKYTAEEYINLRCIKQPEFIANQHLPIARIDGSLYENVMADIGEFVAYHDLEKNTAIIYYGKSQTLSGDIGLEYTILDLPFMFDGDGNYQGPDAKAYITKLVKNLDGHIIPEIPDQFWDQVSFQLDQMSNEIPELFTDPQPGPSYKRQRIERNSDQINYGTVMNDNSSDIIKRRTRREYLTFHTHYIETLVFVTRDITEEFLGKYGEETYIQEIVKKYLNYFNAVDMTFRSLQARSIKLYMNLAKIVIENNSNRFDFINYDVLSFSETVLGARSYLHNYHDIYTPDSFDYVFISTSRTIEHESQVVTGMTDRDLDLYEARKLDQWYIGVPITLLGADNHYILAVHELSRIMDVGIESWDKGIEHTGQCYSIMQSGGAKCKNCLTWSSQNVEQIFNFFRTNRNRCFLLNEPRSLRLPGPSKFLSPFQQCRCFGYPSYVKRGKGNFSRSHVTARGCYVPLQCFQPRLMQSYHEDTLKPFDGTLCNDRAKVCWNGQCVSSINHKSRIGTGAQRPTGTQ